MKYFWLALTILDIVAIIVFLIRKDYASLPFGIFGVFMCGANTILEFKKG